MGGWVGGLGGRGGWGGCISGRGKAGRLTGSNSLGGIEVRGESIF